MENLIIEHIVGHWIVQQLAIDFGCGSENNRYLLFLFPLYNFYDITSKRKLINIHPKG